MPLGPRDAGNELRGATLGILGYRPSGRAVAHPGVALDMTVLVHTSRLDTFRDTVQFVDRGTAIAGADYLSLRTRSGPATRATINHDTSLR